MTSLGYFTIIETSIFVKVINIKITEMDKIKKTIFQVIMKRLAKKNIRSISESIQLPTKELIGYSITTTRRNNQQKEDIPPFFHNIYDNNMLDTLNCDSELKMHCVFNLHKNQEDFDYYIAVENKIEDKKDEYAKIKISAGKYIQVEFIKRNNKVVNMIIMYMRGVWMKSNGYKERNAAPYIMYDERFHSNYQKFGYKGNDYLGEPIATLYLPVED